jgi:transposase
MFLVANRVVSLFRLQLDVVNANHQKPTADLTPFHSSGTVEGLNLKAKLTMRKAYGFKTLKCLQIALYHTLGKLPEPDFNHRFC